MIELIADEDVPRPVIAKLRARGYDVYAIDEEMKGELDQDVLAVARETNRVLVTFDDDFKELAQDADTHPGVLYITTRTHYTVIVDEICESHLAHMNAADLQDTIVHVSP